MALLEPNEQAVARLLASGMTNEQIAARLGFRDKRTISRTNGQIYTAWGLNESATDEKIARARAVLIIQQGRLIAWDEDGAATVMNERGEWVDLGNPALPQNPAIKGVRHERQFFSRLGHCHGFPVQYDSHAVAGADHIAECGTT